MINIGKNKKQAIIIIVSSLIITFILLYFQGRPIICKCGEIYLWVGNIWSSDCSQHIFDPYSFTHFLHGFLFYWLILKIIPNLDKSRQLSIAVIMESIWELIENSNFVINRYRENTIALGYQGDTIINSLSDIFVCGAGFLFAKYIGLRKSIVVFVIIEIILLLWIRDSLILNIIMLIYPSDQIKQWQTGS
jgi:hypothetical protein